MCLLVSALNAGYLSGFLSADRIQRDGFVRVLLAHGWFSFASRFGQKLAGLAILKALRSWFVRFATRGSSMSTITIRSPSFYISV